MMKDFRRLSDPISQIAFAICLFAVAVLGGTSSAISAENRVALVIGNGDYEHVTSLPNPANDASAVSRKLRAIGFDVTTLIDGDLAGMQRSLDAFGIAAEGAEIALIFYAGHGLQVSGENYLIPTDARIGSRNDLGTGAMRAGALYDQFLTAQPDLALVILDACRDNPFVSSVLTTQGLASGAVLPQSFIQRPNNAGTLIAFAAAPGAVALDGEDGNSPYTTALLQWLDRPDLEISTMFRRVRGTVLDLTGGAQVPWVEEALLQDVFLNRQRGLSIAPVGERIDVALAGQLRNFDSDWERQAAEIFYDRFISDGTVQLASARSAPVDDDFVQQGLIWLSIRQSDDPTIFEAFIEQFPNSTFNELAQERLAVLRTGPAPQTVAWVDTLPAPPDADEAPVAVLPGTSDEFSLAPGGPAALNGSASSADLPVIANEVPQSPRQVETALGLNREELSAIQVMLGEGGHYLGGADAEYGSGTRSGIESLQSAAGLPTTGYLDQDSLRALVNGAAQAVLTRQLEPARRAAVHRVAAVAARGPGAETVVVRVEAISRNDTVHAYWRTIADEFESRRAGTTIEIMHRPGGRYQVELMSILGSEHPPDILYTWGGGHLNALREAGFARDLTQQMSDGWALEFKPGALQNYTHDGRIHGVPMHMSLVSLYVNTAVLDRAEISLDRMETWDGFLAVVDELRSRDITPVAIGGSEIWPFSLYFGSLAQQIGGRRVFESALSGEGQGFQAPAFVQAGQELARLGALDPFQRGFVDMDDGEAVEMVARGEAAMVLTGNWRLEKMRWSWPGGETAMRAQMRRLDFPQVQGSVPSNGPVETFGGADGFAVNSAAPEVAIDFLRVLTGRDVQSRMAEIAADVPSVSGSDLNVADPELGRVANTLLQSGYHQLYYDQALGPVAGDVLNDAALRVATGTLSASDAAMTIDAAWDDVLAGVATGGQPGSVAAE